ncbi:MAG: hybrid sensor histidine kinase/response regulator [Candidatus Methylomirabilota bacterium]|nr:MAG: hybrid sensor histidine kinase/response regulator [candidate division NC10 bacterium]
MASLLWTILTPQGFEPHGYCFLWTRPLLWLYIVSDSLITLSYYSIPIALIYFVRKRRDLAFNWVFLFFAVFIVACGTTHLMALWTLWSPLYWLDAAVKAVTAAASVVTAVALWPLIPKALALPSPAQLEAANLSLQEEVCERHRAQEALRAAYDEMEKRVRERTRELTSTAEALQAEITEHELAEQALRESEAKYWALVTQINDGLFVVDVQGVITFANRALAQIHGLESPEQLVGRSLFEFIAPIALDHVKELFTGAVETGITAEVVETQIVRADGESAFIEIKSVPILEDGRVAGFRGILRDVTERKRTEGQIRLQAAALEGAANGIVITDRNGTIRWVNPAFTRLTGYTAEEVVGRTPRLLRSGRHDQAFYRNLWATVLSGRVWQGEIVNRRKDGRLYTEAQTITPVPDEHGDIAHFIAIKQDITEHKRMEEQLRQAQKLEAIGLLAGGIAHDFNNLLNGIIGFAELALKELPEGSRGASYLARVPRLGRQAGSLIGQLLAFARKAPLERQPLDLNPLLKESGKLLQRTFPETITIQVEPAFEPLVANADLGEVQQIILNLATNARDAMPHGGVLTLRLVPVTLTESSLGDHPHRRPGAFACLTVADTGTGIPSAVRDRIFEPFFTTKALGHGTGLGLASVYGIVHQHEGWLEVETAEGQGSAFHVFLPIVPIPADVTPSVGGAMPHGRETLLLVEDNPIVLEMGEILLSDLGYTVFTAADGVEALAVFRTHPNIALVLTDAIMPRMGAADLIPALRALNPDIKVLVSTGYAPDEIRRTLEHLKINGYIRKPFSQADVATAVRAGIDGSVLGRR